MVGWDLLLADALPPQWLVRRASAPHSTVVGSVILWGDFLDFRNCQKKALTHPNQGFSFGAGEMNRTPDLLITNEMKGVFVRVDCC